MDKRHVTKNGMSQTRSKRVEVCVAADTISGQLTTKPSPQKMAHSMAATHQVRVTRERLSLWFDRHYDDGFTWTSEEGAALYKKIQTKTLLFFRNAESTYQVLRDKSDVKWQDARWQKAFLDSPLTELGKVQASALAVRYCTPP